jgi:predicted aldo/keto reductase-like oxidoreductase
MNYRRLGRTGLIVSEVGFGTNQLRLVPERQAIQTLLRGFELGVNLVHTAPDYEGAVEIVARAVRESGGEVIVCSQGYDIHGNGHGRVDHFEHLFEQTCEVFETNTLALFGIACIDDREMFGENVWGRSGMVEFLLRKKEEGRLRAIYCTTHGGPAYVRNLVERDVFDALMIAHNVLGFHTLSYLPAGGRQFENLAENASTIFPLAQARDIGLLIMKPLGGGLLSRSPAFPPLSEVALPEALLPAAEALRAILRHPAVSAVVPGTASVEEAEENARAGCMSAEPDPVRIETRMAILRATLCSRCGKCESTCSQQLPVSWLFRAGYAAFSGATAFETWSEVEYYRLHPEVEATCSTCPQVTCECPAGIDIPASLQWIHREMGRHADDGVLPGREAALKAMDSQPFAARMLMRVVPGSMGCSSVYDCRVFLENTGLRGWFARDNPHRARVELLVEVGTERQRIRLREDAHPGQRTHFAFRLHAPDRPGRYGLRLTLLGEHFDFAVDQGILVYEADLAVVAA